LEADEPFRHSVPQFTGRGSPPHLSIYNPSLGKSGPANQAASELNEDHAAHQPARRELEAGKDFKFLPAQSIVVRASDSDKRARHISRRA
jgi:hypothetical protein